MNVTNENSVIKAFLPNCSSGLCKYHKQLTGVLQSGGIEILSESYELVKAHCAIIVIGAEYRKSLNGATVSDEEYWYEQVRAVNKKDNNFRIFIWQPAEIANNQLSNKQSEFVNSIRNNLMNNMMFFNYASAIMFIEDIRSIIYEEQKVKFDTRQTDVFFIHNEIDEDNANEIIDLLKDVLKVEQLSISLRSKEDYSELVAQQIQKSSLTTIYYNLTANWALPFTQQVWKKIGGASFNKNILMIGDDSYNANHNMDFNAPNITNIFTNTELIPLEIKVFYDKIFTQI